ncbi:MAG: NAD(P)/FAD-dependent oxidoreductase [Polyangiales bacterium]
MTYDCAVIGAGFGGLGAALTLAERGARVVLFESLKYPGGCASTFPRGGWRFESGATLFSGFDPGQLFARWIERHQLPVTTRVPDPIVELRGPDLALAVPPRREAFVERLASLPGAPRDRLDAFFARQSSLADALWSLLDDPALLPPFGPRALVTHLARTPRYLPLLPWIGRPLAAFVDAHGLGEFAPLRVYLDAVSQITVQASAAEAEAPFALATMDYYFHGTRHVHGGIGALATALIDAARALGVDVRLADSVKGLRPADGGWRLRSRRGETDARRVIANLTPHALRGLLGESTARLDALATKVEGGWGAAMLYLGLARDAGLRAEAHHVELVDDAARPFIEGNHVFCSISGADEARGPDGARTVTASTHVPMETLLAMPAEAQGEYVSAVQSAMARTIARRAPELTAATVHRMTASPRTFARFVGRPGGYVGGVPRRAGLANYAGMLPEPVLPGLWMVGTRVPGQSTLATALGGVKVAERASR